MSVNRYKLLREYLHVSNSLEKDNPKNVGNKLFKIQPVLDHVRENCLLIEPEVVHSIDEQIIPAKTKYSGIRQYNPKKPTKWGFKNFVRAGASGIMYDFFLYQGKNGSEKVTGPSVVLKLLETLPRHQNHRVFFDNWFTSIPLCLALKDNGYLCAATLRSDRMLECPLPSDKDLKKTGRGSHASRTDANSGLSVTKWFDNKSVLVVSNFCNIDSTIKVQRWDRSNKKHIDVNCPSVIQEYNKSMGGVDLADMLISLYRTSFKTKRWYIKILFHLVDIAKVNAWLIYRRHCDQLKVAKRSQMSLLQFTSGIASGLTTAETTKQPVGRPRRSDGIDTPLVKRKRPTDIPVADTRYDQVGHWPEFREKKNKCRECKTGTGRVYCKKCDLCLCLSNSRNCFWDFHNKS